MLVFNTNTHLVCISFHKDRVFIQQARVRQLLRKFVLLPQGKADENLYLELTTMLAQMQEKVCDAILSCLDGLVTESEVCYTVSEF